MRCVGLLSLLAVSLVWTLTSRVSAIQHVTLTSSPGGEQTRSSDLRARLDQLVEQLGDESYIKREAAKAEIESYGILAFEKLSAAEMHPNVEIAHSASYLLQSMRVVWTLPTDSFDVQRMLKDYNESSVRHKTDVLQRLANLGRSDGYVALLRLVRYERDERISKTAALEVMGAVINDRFRSPDAPQNLNRQQSDRPYTDRPYTDRRQSGQPQTGRQINWPQMITSSIGDSSRPAAQWLITLGAELDSDAVALDLWQKHVLDERLLLESNAKSTSSDLKTEDQLVKQLYRLVAQLLVAKGKREEALEFFEPCLELVVKDRMSAFHDVQWMLEAGLPEAVLALDQQRPDLLKSRARNRYLLAESYLKLGRNQEADEIARQAQELSVLTPAAVNGLPPASISDAEARQRHENYSFLVERMLFDWAEAELRRVLDKREGKYQVSIPQELNTRHELSRFYWGADQPDKAAQVWEPILARAGLLDDPQAPKPDKADQDLLSEMKVRTANDLAFSTLAPSRYYFYRGLAASHAQDWPAARLHLQKSLAIDGSDPDLLIAMHRAVEGDQQFGQSVDQAIERLETLYRNDVAKAESEVAQAAHRNLRQDHQRLLAEHLNQLAWLLAGTERKTREAIALSQRSLSIEPDYAVYLDTLARCYFADKQFEKAVQIQQRAVDRMPYERSMHRQLAEFQSALAHSK